MDFIMPCCAKRSSAFAIIAFLWVALTIGSAEASDILASHVKLSNTEEGVSLSADFSLDFNKRLEEAVNRGVVLHFSIDFELRQSRWYWFDKIHVRRSRPIQLSYHALTRQYRLSTGGLHQSYTTLEETLKRMLRIRNWQLIGKNELKSDQAFVAALRLRFDLTQLPKTFQVNALYNDDWNFNSVWFRWIFVPDAEPSEREFITPDVENRQGAHPAPSAGVERQ